jgi:chemotaxis protein CheD
MKQIHVGIGEYSVSTGRDDVIKTFALGSCVAVIMYDKAHKVAGLIHIALPDSSVNHDRAKNKPGYFVDTGLPIFLAEMKRKNSNRNSIRIKVVGGSNIMDANNRFDIGKRNVLAIKKYLWKKQLGIIAEDIGGNISRTVSVSVATGKVTFSSKGKSWQL